MRQVLFFFMALLFIDRPFADDPGIIHQVLPQLTVDPDANGQLLGINKYGLISTASNQVFALVRQTHIRTGRARHKVFRFDPLGGNWTLLEDYDQDRGGLDSSGSSLVEVSSGKLAFLTGGFTTLSHGEAHVRLGNLETNEWKTVDTFKPPGSSMVMGRHLKSSHGVLVYNSNVVFSDLEGRHTRNFLRVSLDEGNLWHTIETPGRNCQSSHFGISSERRIYLSYSCRVGGGAPDQHFIKVSGDVALELSVGNTDAWDTYQVPSHCSVYHFTVNGIDAYIACHTTDGSQLNVVKFDGGSRTFVPFVVPRTSMTGSTWLEQVVVGPDNRIFVIAVNLGNVPGDYTSEVYYTPSPQSLQFERLNLRPNIPGVGYRALSVSSDGRYLFAGGWKKYLGLSGQYSAVLETFDLTQSLVGGQP